MNQLHQLLHQLRLSGLRETLSVRLQEAAANRLAPEEFLTLVLQDEINVRQQRQIQRRVKVADFSRLKPLDEFDWRFNPSISERKKGSGREKKGQAADLDIDEPSRKGQVLSLSVEAARPTPMCPCAVVANDRAARLAPALRGLRSVTRPASSFALPRMRDRSVRWSPAPWAAACARRIGRGTRRSADPRRRRRSSASLRFAPSRRRPPSQPHGDPAAPGWHRARLNRRPNAAFADALRGAAGRRSRSRWSPCDSLADR